MEACFELARGSAIIIITRMITPRCVAVGRVLSIHCVLLVLLGLVPYTAATDQRPEADSTRMERILELQETVGPVVPAGVRSSVRRTVSGILTTVDGGEIPAGTMAVHLQVLDQTTGEPIEGAAIYWVEIISPNHVQAQGNPLQTEPSGFTNDEGIFLFDFIPDDERWAVVVAAEDYTVDLVRGLAAGGGTRVVELARPTTRAIRILLPPHLAERRRLPVAISEFYSLANTSATLRTDTPNIEVRDGAVELEFINLTEGELTVSLRAERSWETLYRAPLAEVPGEKVIDLRESTVGRQQEERQVVVKLVNRSAEEPVTGNILVRRYEASLDSQAPRTWGIESIEVVDGQITFSLPVSNEFQLQPIGLSGFWFESKRWEVPLGEEPFEVEIPVKPGGAIAGQLRWNGSSEGRGFTLGLNSPEVDDHLLRMTLNDSLQLSDYQISTKPVEIFVQPLPLDVELQLVFATGIFRDVFSFTLTEEEPILEFDWALAKPIQPTGRVVDAKGDPVGGIPFMVRAIVEEEGNRTVSNSSALLKSQSDGTFELPELVPEGAVRWELEVPIRSRYQPLLQTFDPRDGVVEVRLEKGMELVGRLVDATTGEGIDGIQIGAGSPEFPVVRSLGDPGGIGGVMAAFIAEQPTHDNGQFRFTTLPDHPVNLFIMDNALLRDGTVAPIQVHPGQSGDQPVTLEWHRSGSASSIPQGGDCLHDFLGMSIGLGTWRDPCDFAIFDQKGSPVGEPKNAAHAKGIRYRPLAVGDQWEGEFMIFLETFLGLGCIPAYADHLDSGFAEISDGVP